MTEFSPGQTMLTLALLASRGFWDPAKNNQPGLGGAITAGLESLPPVRNQWQLVWGPGTYRYLGSAFDSSMMFVVQHSTQPQRYAIVVRGTNPVALFDWLLGDFLGHRQVPWHTSKEDIAPGAALSLSTALGLKILLSMRAANDPGQVAEPGRFDLLLERSAATLARTRQAGGDSLAKVGEAMADSTLGSTMEKTRKLLKKILKYQQLWNATGGFTSSVGATVGELLRIEDIVSILKVRKRLISSLDRTLETQAEAPTAILMPTPEELQSQQSPGIGLLELLRNLANTHGDALELFVTGHSKGGALAPALALFLSDTQSNGEHPIPDYYQWNPEHRARIHCYAFAGPTPGNTDFARYFNRQLGRDFYRYSNGLDIVTLAWHSEQLRTAAGLYGQTAGSPPGLDLLFSEMADEVEALDYCHPGEDYPDPKGGAGRLEKHVIQFESPLQGDTSSYLLQELHQHIEAYIAFLGLDKVMSLKQLLGASKPG